MKLKKYLFYVSVSYADDDIDVFCSSDYGKAAATARRIWNEGLENWRKTGENGVLSVDLFDFEGRLLWTSAYDLGDVGRLFDFIQGKPMPADVGFVSAPVVRTLN